MILNWKRVEAVSKMENGKIACEQPLSGGGGGGGRREETRELARKRIGKTIFTT